VSRRRSPGKGASAASRRPADRPRTDAARQRREAARAQARDRDLAPHDRGPVRAFVRDLVDARRRLVGMFMPVLGAVVICLVSPASDLQRTLLLGGLALLGVVLVDAVLLGVEVTRAVRTEFPDEEVAGLATGWYAFLRAHRPRTRRWPPVRVGPGAVPPAGRR
jgi:hypothetical protein